MKGEYLQLSKRLHFYKKRKIQTLTIISKCIWCIHGIPGNLKLLHRIRKICRFLESQLLNSLSLPGITTYSLVPKLDLSTTGALTNPPYLLVTALILGVLTSHCDSCLPGTAQLAAASSGAYQDCSWNDPTFVTAHIACVSFTSSSLWSVATWSPPLWKSSSIQREWSRTSKLLPCCRTYLQHGTIYNSKAPASSPSAEYATARPDLVSIYVLTELLQHAWMTELLSSCNKMFVFQSSSNLCKILTHVIKNLITWINKV